MTVTERKQTFKYEVGEEVLVRLQPYAVVHVETENPTVTPLPRWTIAEIRTREVLGGEPSYRLVFTLYDDRLATTVPEFTIDGTV